MNDQKRVPNRNELSSAVTGRKQNQAHGESGSDPATESPETQSSLDFLSVIDSLLRALALRWRLLLLSCIGLGVLGSLVGFIQSRPRYIASTQLILSEAARAQDHGRGRTMTMGDLTQLLRSRELAKRVAEKAGASYSAGSIASGIQITTERNSDIINLSMTRNKPQEAVELANLYAAESVFFSPSQLVDRTQQLREELASLLERYTEAHPLVRQQRAKIRALEQESQKPAGIPASAEAPHGGSHLPYYQVLTPATMEGVRMTGGMGNVIVFMMVGLILGAGGGIAFVCLRELMDPRLKTAADVRRVTKLPVLASLGDLRKMGPMAQANWAFRTWTSLQKNLEEQSVDRPGGMVCGITSSTEGEGLSTWMNLLAQAARQRGFRVLTVGARTPFYTDLDSPAGPEGAKVITPTLLETGSSPHREGNVESPIVALERSASLATRGQGNGNGKVVRLESPAQIMQQLTKPDAQPIVHVRMEHSALAPECRGQWQTAMAQWKKMENLVVLVELPPASSPQGVLMAENLPHVIWLSDTEKSDAAESAAQVKTLRETACNLVGAVLNRAPEPLIKNRFVRWFGYSSYLWIAASFPLQAQEAATISHSSDAPRAEVRGEHIAALSHARAPWQERLTLGPGDVLNLHLYGEPELTRSEVAVSPDGTITYLEALDVPAAGLTVDELRARLDSELSKYRREPRTIVVPVSYQSKKYFMLGGVAEKGAFTLERPITLLEAISRSRGLETANVDGNIVEMHDFSRSFLSRNGRRVPVDFERLFLRGDLTQNVQLAPGDYVYVAPGDLKEVYVLGEVGAPGIVSYTHGLSAIGAIAGRGGFTTRAWQKRVLVVRGSMQNPETFILNTSEVLSARGAGFEMQARDIIFVSSRPWAKAEDLLDIAITAFLEAAVITWTGQTITPIIR